MRSFTGQMYNRRQFAPLASDHVDGMFIASKTPARFAVPSDAKFVVFSGTANFCAKFGSSSVTAAVPSSTAVLGTASELNPEAREVPEGATHLSIVPVDDCTITLAWYGA